MTTLCAWQTMSRGLVIWISGIPSAGKTTIGREVARILGATFIDGDVFRNEVSHDLGFGPKDRRINVERLAYVGAAVADSGGICVIAGAAPRPEDRRYARNYMGRERVVWVWAKCSLAEAKLRDTQDLYKDFGDGVVGDVEHPRNPEKDENLVVCMTDREAIYESVYKVLEFVGMFRSL